MFFCLLFSPATCDQKSQHKHPLAHNPLVLCQWCVASGQDPASWVRYGQEYALVYVFNKNTRRVLSYDVLRQQKTELWPRIASSLSQTVRPSYLVQTIDDGCRRECSARRRPRQLYFFTLRDSNDLQQSVPGCTKLGLSVAGTWKLEEEGHNQQRRQQCRRCEVVERGRKRGRRFRLDRHWKRPMSSPTCLRTLSRSTPQWKRKVKYAA